MWILFLFLCQINLFFILRWTIYNVQIPVINWLNSKFKIPIRYNLINYSTPLFTSFIVHLVLLVSGWTIYNVQIPVINWLNSKFKIPIRYNLIKEYTFVTSNNNTLIENEEIQSDFNKVVNDINTDDATEDEKSDATEDEKSDATEDEKSDNILFDESLD